MSANESHERVVQPFERDDDGPLFDEPWQAQSLAIVERMIVGGCFSAQDWAQTLGQELRADDSDDYYAAVLRALERLLVEGGQITEGDLRERMAAWTRAYERTPHGEPVELSAGRES